MVYPCCLPPVLNLHCLLPSSPNKGPRGCSPSAASSLTACLCMTISHIYKCPTGPPFFGGLLSNPLRPDPPTPAVPLSPLPSCASRHMSSGHTVSLLTDSVPSRLKAPGGPGLCVHLRQEGGRSLAQVSLAECSPAERRAGWASFLPHPFSTRTQA